MGAAEGRREPVTTAELGSLPVCPARDAPVTAVTLNDTRRAAETAGVITDSPVQVGGRVKKREVWPGLTVPNIGSP